MPISLAEINAKNKAFNTYDRKGRRATDALYADGLMQVYDSRTSMESALRMQGFTREGAQSDNEVWTNPNGQIATVKTGQNWQGFAVFRVEIN
jgi:hypothetical protein